MSSKGCVAKMRGVMIILLLCQPKFATEKRNWYP
jgi:hypothetical protein